MTKKPAGDELENEFDQYFNQPISSYGRKQFKEFFRQERLKATRDEQMKAIDEKIEIIKELQNYYLEMDFFIDFTSDKIQHLQNQKQQLLK